MCGTTTDQSKAVIAAKEETTSTKGINDYAIKVVTDPNIRFRRYWFVISSIIYIAGFFIDTSQIAFELYPLLKFGMKSGNTCRAAIMMVDVIMTFFTAIPRSTVKYTLNENHDDPKIRQRERSFGSETDQLKKLCKFLSVIISHYSSFSCLTLYFLVETSRMKTSNNSSKKRNED